MQLVLQKERKEYHLLIEDVKNHVNADLSRLHLILENFKAIFHEKDYKRELRKTFPQYFKRPPERAEVALLDQAVKNQIDEHRKNLKELYLNFEKHVQNYEKSDKG